MAVCLSKPIRVGLLAAALVGMSQLSVSARRVPQVLVRADEAAELRGATLVCKVKMGTITESDTPNFDGPTYNSTGTVISLLKGEIGQEVPIRFERYVNGPLRPGVDAVKAGDVYLIMLRGGGPPYEMYGAMRAVDRVVEPTFGTKPGDRLLAELVAMCTSNDAAMRIAAVEQIGVIRDKRASDVVATAAADRDAATARAAVIAQYRMKIAPDAKRVMDVFDEGVMDVWYEESGVPQKNAQGKHLWRVQGRIRLIERGLPDFDYATYVREGIKNDWVRKDDHTLYRFFGAPWKVQRRECVPEFVKLLDDPDQRVRWWGVKCLSYTVEHIYEHSQLWDDYRAHEEVVLKRWRLWWKDEGQAYLTEPVTHPDDG